MSIEEQRRRVQMARICAENASWRMGPTRRAELEAEQAKLAAMIDRRKDNG